MPKINIESIKQELSNIGWQIKTEQYTNLKTEMEFICNEGHTVFSTWERIRQKAVCPICEKNIFKDPKMIIIPKQAGKTRVLALDQATHITGWSVFDGDNLIQYGIYKAKDNEDEFSRLHEINIWFISMLKNWNPDFVGIEGIQYQENAGVTTFQALGRLQGILGETCRQYDVPFKICPPGVWRQYCKVKGKNRSDRKRSMQLIVKQNYDISVSDDCADAIGIGKYTSATYMKTTEVINWE